jgi:signal transduction histidine kinase
MTNLVIALQQAIYVAFLALCLVALREWLRYRDRSRGIIALALGLLAAVVVASDADSLTGARYPVLNMLVYALFPWSGYALLLFRDSFIPLSRRARLISGAVVAAVSLAGLWFGALTDANGQRVTPGLYYTVWLLVWTACVVEPIVRFWLESRGRAAVQRTRLRALSFGYGLVVLILAFGYVTQAESRNPTVLLVVQLASLLVVPLLYASFAPPNWLRVLWRQREEEEFGRGMQDLLLFTEDAEGLAARALDWAARLVGAEAAAIGAGGARLLAFQGTDRPRAQALVEAGAGVDGELRSDGGSAIAIPLPLNAGPGTLVAVAGPFTPLFGADEVARLRQYAVALTTALDRVALVQEIQETAEDLARSNRALEEFVYVASHDLQEPLRTVTGYVQLLQRRYQGKLDPDADEFIGFAVEGASRMQALINDLLTYSRVGSKDARLVETDFGDVVDEVLAGLQAAVEESGAEVSHGRLPKLVADRRQMVQLFQNLIGNAIKFHSDDPPRVEIHAGRDGEAWRFAVRDNGIGIPPEHHDRIFNLFQRLHARDEYPGTGIGLALCRRIVERHGGRIWVESEPRKGSTFYFTIGKLEVSE